MRVATKHRTLFLVAAIVAAALTVAACGGDDDEDTIAAPTTTTEGTTGATEAAGKAEQLDISETEYKLDPADPSAKAGTVTIKATDDGEVTHNLEVEGNGVEEELPADLGPGDSGEVTVDLAPGTYELYCPIGNHRELGMEGELTVE